MARKPPKPSDEEKQILWDLMFDSCLFQAHGIIVHQVQAGITRLLEQLGRKDLAELWADTDALNRSSGPRKPS